MALLCFKCNKFLGSSKDYIKHLRISHHIIQGSSFTCATPCNQDGCYRTFKYTWSLKRHLQKEHSRLFDDPPYEVVPQPVHEPLVNDDDDASDSDNNLEMNDGGNLEEAELPLSSNDIKLKCAQLVCNLKAKTGVTNTTVSLVRESTSELISNVMEYVHHKFTHFIADVGMDDQNRGAQEFLGAISELKEPFSEIDTDYKFMKYLKESNYYVAPKFIPLGPAYVQRTDPNAGGVRQIQIEQGFQYIPIKSVLKLVLERPGVMDSIMEHQEIGGEDVLMDFQDGDYLKNHNFLTRQTVVILLYADEVEIANPLGPKAGCHKLTMVYFAIKSLPSKFLSTLDQCFLVAICLSTHVKSYGWNTVLRPIIDDLKVLEHDGLDIESNAYSGKVLIGLAQVTGDNLGVNGLLGFVESFSANFPCRHCKMHKNQMKTTCVEDVSLLRNEENYEDDIAIDNLSDTGIKFRSIFNELQSFHVTRNYAPDIMHDLLEGVCMWEMKLVIAHLIETGKFTLEDLNGRITSYDYGFQDSANKPCCFTAQDIRSPESATGQTASQMYCLLRHFCLMMGDLVPQDNDKWQVIVLLLQCMDIIFSPCVSKGETYYLKQLIQDHHQYFLTVFPGQHLKPKHHFMLHYPRAIRMLGALIQYWAMRFEANHRPFKRTASSTCNFKNIAFSLAKGNQINLCSTFLSGRSLNDSILEVGPGSSVLLASLDNADAISRALGGYQLFDDVFVANWVIKYGTKYRNGMMVVMDKTPNFEPIFGQIRHVLVIENSQVQLVIEQWISDGFCQHLHAYAVRPRNPVELVALEVEELFDHHPLHATKAYMYEHEAGETWYISPRYKL